MNFLALFLSLPAKAASDRMRVWRGLRALGCATLRDGVYLLPESETHCSALSAIAEEVQTAGGSGDIYLLSGCDETGMAALTRLFDRGEEYGTLISQSDALRAELKQLPAAVAARRMQALTRRFEQLYPLDFFPGPAQQQAQAQLAALRQAYSQHLSPDEPNSGSGTPPRLARAEYQGRTWATRRRPWVDRLASAWLIQRRIDPQAQLVWLAAPADCAPDWLGFDFDGARFSHVGNRVTFETLLFSFGLEQEPALQRLGALVHYLDVGGAAVAEAAGFEALLTGLRADQEDDDTLLAEAGKLFDWLLSHYEDSKHD